MRFTSTIYPSTDPAGPGRCEPEHLPGRGPGFSRTTGRRWTAGSTSGGSPWLPRTVRGLAPVLVVLVAGAGPAAGTATLLHLAPRTSASPINHVVVLLMENHAYDNLFGTYCLTTARACHMAAHGIPAGTCVPINTTNLSQGCVRPWNYTVANYSTTDPPHGYNASNQAVNNGSMNGFYAAEHAGLTPFGHYNGSLLGFYWDLAEEYGLGDNFYSSALADTLPNHWYLLAGKAPPIAMLPTPLDYQNTTGLHVYLNQSNQTKTVQDLLNASPSVSWKFYDWALPNYSEAIEVNATPGNPRAAEYTAYNYRNPLAARAESYTSWYVSHFVNRSVLFQDAAAGTLPNVSWIMPGAGFSDHPPLNLTHGEKFIASIVDSLESSPEWNSTVLFVAWDDYGGFYDHQAPPAKPAGLSIRVPFLVISPFAKRDYVGHGLGYFESTLHFIEQRFGLGCLTPRDCGAPSLASFFNFSQTPRAPIHFSPGERYPIGLQTATRNPSVRWTVPPPTTWDSAPPPPSLPVTSVD